MQLGICKCDIGFVGSTCSEKCPHGPDGTSCSGHGICELDESRRSQCVCDDGWVGNSCASRVCNTEGGVLGRESNQCTCPVGEVCCDKETHRLATMMRQLLSKEKRHETSKKVLKAQHAFLEHAAKASLEKASLDDLTL